MKVVMRVNVDSGKYAFVIGDDGHFHILRDGVPWCGPSHMGANAIRSLVCELDAARVVLVAARQLGSHAPIEIKRALARHDGLVDDREPPSEWTDPAR